MKKIKQSVKQRVINSWRSTIIALAILATAIFALIKGYITGTEFGALMPFVLLLLGIKDTTLGFRDKCQDCDKDNDRPSSRDNDFGPAIILIPLMFMMLSGCVTYNRCVEKFGKTTPGATVYIHDTIINNIFRPADTNTAQVKTDTMQHGRHYTSTDSTSKIQIEYWYDKYTKLFNMRATTPADTIHDTIIYDSVVPCPDQTALENPPKEQSLFWKTYGVATDWCAPFLLLFLIIILIKLIRK